MITTELKQLVLKTLDDAKAKEVVALDVGTLTSITDTMIFCSGTSNRHVKSISDYIIKAAKENQAQILGVEGEDTSEWILVDLGDVVVHIMQPETREFYQLEKFWGFREQIAS